MKKTQANRGMSLEELVMRANDEYQVKQMAFIQKIPTPVKVMKSEKGIIKHGWFDKKSTIDFMGVTRGLFIGFECKSTKEKSFPLKNIADHQIEALEQMYVQGGITFFLVEFEEKKEIYILPFKDAKHWLDLAQQGGRKSIPYDFFVSDCILVKAKDGFSLHYLETYF